MLLDFFVPLTAEWGLLNAPTRRRMELSRCNRLPDKEVFYAVDVPKALARYKDPAVIAKVYADQRAMKEDEKRDEVAKRTDVVAGMAEQSPTWKKDLQADKDWIGGVSSFVRWELEKDHKIPGVKIPRAAMRHPRRLPTYWYEESFYRAKVGFVLIDSKKELTSKRSLQAMPSLLEANHFSDAAYADILVTTDQDVLTVAKHARARLQVLTFDEFAARILAVASSFGIQGDGSSPPSCPLFGSSPLPPHTTPTNSLDHDGRPVPRDGHDERPRSR